RRRRRVRREERGDLDALRAGELAAETAADHPDAARHPDGDDTTDRATDAKAADVPAGGTPDPGPRPG
uniref:hypothetical protein n=1 Tax=Desertihabitans aurantiacus TaxID=2282477 RepID=UPI0018E56121